MTDTRMPTATPGDPPPSRRGLLLVDDHPMMRAGLALLLNGTPDLAVSGEAGTAAEALRFLETRVPDALIHDLTLPDRSGIDLLRDITRRHPGLPVLVVSMHDEQLYAGRASQAGASGYVMKEAGGARLLEAIRHILAGGRVFPSRMAADPVETPEPDRTGTPLESLTQREYEVFLLLGGGRNTRTVADMLGLSPKTVDVHRANIKVKLGLQDVPALIRQAVRWIETGRFDQ